MEVSQGGDAYGGRGPEIIGVTWALTTITTIVILLRLYVRFFMVQQVCAYKDSWALAWAVLAWLFGVLGTSFLSVAAHYGVGNHLGIVKSQGNLSNVLLYAWIWSTFSTLMIVWAKFSVVTFLIAIQSPTHRIHRWILNALVGITLCTNTVNIFLLWFQCDPAQKSWEVEIPGNCRLADINYRYSLFSGSWSAFVDLYLTLFPVHIIYKLEVSIRWKGVLAAVLGLGVISCVCACMRAYELEVVHNSIDLTYDSVPLILWSVAESWVMLVASGIPPQWPLISGYINIPSDNYVGRGKGKENGDVEASYSNRTSARSEATTTTDASTLNNSIAGQDLEGAIAVKREITVDREARQHHHGARPRALTRSWAAADRRGSLARWSSSRTLRSPSWARGI